MKLLNQQALSIVAGGEINPGWPSPEVTCINVKLLILAGFDQPAFDVSAATMALMNACPIDFWDMGMAHEYVVSGGGMPFPGPLPASVPLIAG